ncbi:carbohydrate kinase family protein [Candidatus Woesearchaeota archaeon]|nr:carbohydrate kinase family protein [Candidatus Woesearchaeota archaeon]
MYDIITVGSATVDAFAETDRKYVKKKKYSFPVGAKLLIKNLHFDVGGGGTNTAVCFSRLGLKTGYIGKLGRGENSRRITNLLKEEKIDTSMISRENSRTGFSVILDAKGHDRTILAFKGSNDDLQIRDIRHEHINTEWFYFSSMMGKSWDTLKHLAEYASTHNIKVAFNASKYLTEKGMAYLKPIVSKCEILVLNYEEARDLAKKKDIRVMLRVLSEAGPKYVVITNGAKPCFAYDGEKIYTIKPHKIKILETTGAGDAFASSFVAGIIKTNDMEFSLQLALANAEAVLTHYGAKNNLMKMGEAIRAIKRSPGKMTMKKVK